MEAKVVICIADDSVEGAPMHGPDRGGPFKAGDAGDVRTLEPRLWWVVL